MQRDESSLISSQTHLYLRDVYDHTIQVIDTIEGFRDMAAGMLEIYLSSVSNRMNAVMKVLTIISTIFLPLGVITGFFGMNFSHMPFEWEHGAIATTLGMVLVAIGMLIFFRIRKWI